MRVSAASLIRITAHARAGALDHAWRLFTAAGLDRVDDDPAVLSLRGRLLKDRALRASGAERRAAAHEAAAAYAAAARIAPAAYPLINAATLALVAGDRAESAAIARGVLDHLAASGDDEDTPYYRAATEAEARLLTVDVAGARTALERAIALAPRAWEDHASTLRQFAVILDALGEAGGWLGPLRPPKTLHFAGHMNIGEDEAAIAARIDAIVEREGVGQGFGALAAGADLLIAERLLTHGAEVHVVLPGGRDAFEARSVAPYGGNWPERFAAALAAAASVGEIGHADAYDRSIELADLVAMGRAAMAARSLATTAIQLLVGPDDASAGAQTERSARIWAAAGRRQLIVPSPAAPAPAADKATPETAAVLALLAVSLRPAPDMRASGFDADFAARLRALSRLAASPGVVGPARWSGDNLIVAFAAAGDAFDAAQSLAGGDVPLRRALDIGVVARHANPLDGRPLLFGEPLETVAAIAEAAPEAALVASEAFAAALIAARADDVRAEFIGELTSMQKVVPLFSLRAAPGG